MGSSMVMVGSDGILVVLWWCYGGVVVWSSDGVMVRYV